MIKCADVPADLASGRHVAVVLPAYNEAAALPEVLAGLGRVLDEVGLPYRIVVVDDGSTDGTAEIVEKAAGSSAVLLVRHRENKGLGAALKTGLLEAVRTSGIVVTLDADNTHDPLVIPQLVSSIMAGSDVAVASRFRRGAVSRGIPLHRHALSIGASLLMRTFCPVKGARDYSSGYRAYRSTAIRRTVGRLGADEFIRETGFACMVELLLNLAATGAIVAEVPIILRYDEKRSASKMPIFKTIGRYGSLVRNHRSRRAGIRSLEPVVRPVHPR